MTMTKQIQCDIQVVSIAFEGEVELPLKVLALFRNPRS
jgi:hypothetical protein